MPIIISCYPPPPHPFPLFLLGRSQISISSNPVQKLASSMGSLHLTPTKSAKNAAALAAAAAAANQGLVSPAAAAAATAANQGLVSPAAVAAVANQGLVSPAATDNSTTQEGHQGKPPKPPVRTSSMRLK